MESKNKLTKPIILIIGIIAFTLSGLNWNIGIAAWIAPILLLRYSKTTKWKYFIWLFLGMVFSASVSKSAENLAGIFIIYITTGLVYGVINCLPYILEKLLVDRGDKFYKTFIFPSAVVVTEYLLSLLIGIWGNTSIAQFYNFSFIQICSLFGIFGISFLIAWFASIINWIIDSNYNPKSLKLGLGIYAIVFVTVIFYGQLRIEYHKPQSKTVKVAAIKSEIDIHDVFKKLEKEIIELSKNYNKVIPDSIFSENTFIESQIHKTREALNNGAKIVVWNEISLILNQTQVAKLKQEIKNLCVIHNAYVVIAFLENNVSSLPKPFNNKSILITPEGEIAWEHIKYFLNPLERLIINSGDATIPFIDTKYGRIGNVLCSDLDVSIHIASAAKNEVDILLVPAYDWKEVTPYHSNMAVFSAIQFGISIVRSNGKGIVAFIDYQGNTIAQMNTFVSDRQIYYADVPIKSIKSVYSRIGDIIVYLSMLFLLVAFGLKFKSSAPNTQYSQ